MQTDRSATKGHCGSKNNSTCSARLQQPCLTAHTGLPITRRAPCWLACHSELATYGTVFFLRAVCKTHSATVPPMIQVGRTYRQDQAPRSRRPGGIRCNGPLQRTCCSPVRVPGVCRVVAKTDVCGSLNRVGQQTAGRTGLQTCTAQSRVRPRL